MKEVCPYCGKEFNPAVRLEKRICPYCAKEFLQNRPYQIYCSQECCYKDHLLESARKRARLKKERFQ